MIDLAAIRWDDKLACAITCELLIRNVAFAQEVSELANQIQASETISERYCREQGGRACMIYTQQFQ